MSDKLKCCICKKMKSKDAFYKCRTNTTGYLYSCKECTKKYVTERSKEKFKSNRKEVLEYRREYYLKNREKIKATSTQYIKEHPESTIATHNRRDKRFLDKYGMTYLKIVNEGIKYNKEEQPCSVCESTRDPERHHPNYFKPKEIIWYCRGCHRDLHRLNNANK